VVDTKSENRKWLDIVEMSSRPNNIIRCFNSRLGSIMLWSLNGRFMVEYGKEVSYKHFRIKGSKASHSNLHKNCEIYPHSDGQYIWGRGVLQKTNN